MTKKILRLCLAFGALSCVSTECTAQALSEFNPNPISIEQVDQLDKNVTVEAAVNSQHVADNFVVRNALVIIALGLTFSLGMAITATTIRQNRPSTPQQTNYYAP